jgi:3-oxoadipate enol-lactonase
MERSAVESGYVSLPGAEIFYEVTGAGTPVVLVHGLGLDARMWDDQAPPLAGEATVIRYDARGFGRSPRHDDVTPYTHPGDLWALLDRLDVESAVLVGLSMGGRIVLEAALEEPTRTRGLVLLDAVVDGVPWDAVAGAAMSAVGERVRQGDLDGGRATWLAHPFFTPARRRPELAARLAVMVDDYSMLAWTSPDPHGSHPDCLTLLPTVSCPTEVVVGELDVPGFRQMSETLARGIPVARLTVVPDAGHMVNMEAPETVTGLILDAVRAVGDG